MAFSEIFSVKKRDPTPVKSLLENTMENPFFYFLKYRPNCFEKNLESKYEHSHFKYAFGINFGLWEVVKLEIRKYFNFLTEKMSENSKLPKICLSFSGSMPEAQI